MAITAKKRILDYLRTGEWVHKGQLEAQFMNWGYEVSNIDRRCRELAKEGRIERRLNNKGHVEYKLKGQMTADEANSFLRSLRQGQLV